MRAPSSEVSDEGFVALFGAPVAPEDHARRAVLAALELRQRWRAFAAMRGGPAAWCPPGAAQRATGGGAAGIRAAAAVYGGRHLHGHPGPAASRACHHPGQRHDLRIGARRSAGPACEPLAREASSPPAPVYAIHDLERRRAGVLRRGTRPRNRFVGRTQDLAPLHARLAQAVDGQGQAIGIVGEPGPRQSRLLAESPTVRRGRP